MSNTNNALSPNQVAAAVSARLHANESPYMVPADVWREIEEQLTTLELNRYPDRAMRLFYQALAEETGFPKEMLLAGNGLEEIILLLLVALGRKGRVVLPTPTFFVYEQVATALGLSILKLPLIAESWQLDIPLIVQEAGQKEGLIIICRPNNPTGNVFPREDVLRLLNETKLTVVVDEAYYGFSDDTMLDDLVHYDRLIILRTFSKTHGLAGIRLGYLLANPEIVKIINRVRPTFNLNALTATIGRVALKRQKQLFASVPTIIAERERLAAELEGIPGVTVYPSETNFILIKLPCAAAPLWQELRQAGIHIRKVSEEMPEFLRISVGLLQENEKLLSALRQHYGIKDGQKNTSCSF